MNFGKITRSAAPITLAEWNEIIASHASLVQMPDRMAINPFTNKEIPASGVGKALFVVENETVGNAALDDGEILTTGVPQDICSEIARLRGAEVSQDDRS